MTQKEKYWPEGNRYEVPLLTSYIKFQRRRWFGGRAVWRAETTSIRAQQSDGDRRQKRPEEDLESDG